MVGRPVPPGYREVFLANTPLWLAGGAKIFDGGVLSFWLAGDLPPRGVRSAGWLAAPKLFQGRGF